MKRKNLFRYLLACSFLSNIQNAYSSATPYVEVNGNVSEITNQGAVLTPGTPDKYVIPEALGANPKLEHEKFFKITFNSAYINYTADYNDGAGIEPYVINGIDINGKSATIGAARPLKLGSVANNVGGGNLIIWATSLVNNIELTGTYSDDALTNGIVTQKNTYNDTIIGFLVPGVKLIISPAAPDYGPIIYNGGTFHNAFNAQLEMNGGFTNSSYISNFNFAKVYPNNNQA